MGLPWEDGGGQPSFVRKEAVCMVTYGELFEQNKATAIPLDLDNG